VVNEESGTLSAGPARLAHTRDARHVRHQLVHDRTGHGCRLHCRRRDRYEDCLVLPARRGSGGNQVGLALIRVACWSLARRPDYEDSRWSDCSLRDLHEGLNDAGLDQAFNSLDAQYNASQAYIRSQGHAGWTLVKTRYDDSGLAARRIDHPCNGCSAERLQQTSFVYAY
jgi:hypothetical protein